MRLRYATIGGGARGNVPGSGMLGAGRQADAVIKVREGGPIVVIRGSGAAREIRRWR